MRDANAIQISQPSYYRIYIQGETDIQLLRDYISLRIDQTVAADGTPVTIISGEFVDQSAVIGVLNLMSDFGYPLLGFECVPYRKD